MKAWKVKVDDEFYYTVVFAEIRGKARYPAMRTDCCGECKTCMAKELCQVYKDALKEYYEKNNID